MNISNFQRSVWNDFFMRTLQELLDSRAFVHNGVNVSFSVKNASVFLRPPVMDAATNIQKLLIDVNLRDDYGQLTIPNMPLIELPVLGANGFLLDNVKYSLVNSFRLASGWYIKVDEVQKPYLTLQREAAKVFKIVQSKKGLRVVFENKRKDDFDLFDFLKVISGNLTMSDQDILDEFSDCQAIMNAYAERQPSEDSLNSIAADVLKAFRGYDGVVSSDPISDLHNYLVNNGLRLHAEKIPRFAMFTSFKRAVGTTLAEDIQVGNTVLYAGETLSASDLNKLDASGRTSLHIVKNDRVYTLKRVEASKGLSYEELCCALRVFDQYLAGIGRIDKPDEQYNRVLHTIRDEYEIFVGRALSKLIGTLTKHLSNCTNAEKRLETLCAQETLYECTPADEIIKYIKSGNSLYQQLDETNSLSQFEQSFRISSSAKEVPVSARDVHGSEYGRVCPYTTSESKQVGLNRALSVKCNVDNYGFVTMPVYRFSNGKISTEVMYLSAIDELSSIIAPANIDLEQLWSEHQGDSAFFVQNCRVNGELQAALLADVTHQEMSGLQTIGPLISTVPSANRDSGKRLVMTVSAQRQALPTWRRERPLVTTGVDALCEIGYVSANSFAKEYLESMGIQTQDLVDVKLYLDSVQNLENSNQIEVNVSFAYQNSIYTPVKILNGPRGTVNGALKYMRLANPAHVDNKGKYYEGSDVFLYNNDVDIAEYKLDKDTIHMDKLEMNSDSISNHSVALGCNVKVLFKSMAGYTYEDSIVVNEDFLLKYGLAVVKTKTISFTLPEHTKVGINTRDIQNVPQLDEWGYPRKGFYVQTGQEILSVRSTKDGIEKMSMRHLGVGESGYVMSYRTYKKGKDTIVSIDLGDLSQVEVGDKLEGLHGNKGVIGCILPKNEMVFTEDGDIPDLILNPLGVVSRLNLGQMVEARLGAIAEKTHEIKIFEPFASDSVQSIANASEQQALVEKTIYDGRTGLPFPHKAVLGNMYMLRLMHTSTSKYNATGSCKSNISTRTLQPMRCQGGGQRISELCTWCLVSYNATETLNSLFTVQSDSYKDKLKLDMAIAKQESTDIPYSSNNIDTMKAYFYMLGANIYVATDGSVKLEPLTDAAMREIAGSEHVCTIDATRTRYISSILHDARVFGTSKDPAENRKQYGYLPFGCEMIMPMYLSSRNVKALLAGEFRDSESSEIRLFDDRTIQAILDGNKHLVGWNENIETDVSTYKDTGKSWKQYIEEEYDVILPDTYSVPILVDSANIDIEDMSAKTGISAMVEIFKKYNVLSSLCFRTDDLRVDRIANIVLFSKNYTLADLVVRGMLIPPVGYRPVTEDDRTGSNPIDAVLNKIVGSIATLESHKSNKREYENYVRTLYKCLNNNLIVNDAKNPEHPSIIRQLTNHDSNLSIVRDTMLAKRVSYSGRSVISIGPDLAPGECGIPVVLLTTIFEEHIVSEIVSKNKEYILNQLLDGNNQAPRDRKKFIRKAIRYLAAKNLVGFKTHCFGSGISAITKKWLENATGCESIYQLFEKCYAQLISVLNKLLQTHPALLNREPSLHKFSISGFHTRPIDSYAIQLHPAACKGFNADYDGDQMAVYYPMHERGIKDVEDKMMFTDNLIDPKDGTCIVALNQDIVLGLYYATIHANNSREFSPTSIARYYSLPDFNGFGEQGYLSAGICKQILEDVQLGLVDIQDTVICYYKDRKYIGEAGRFIVNAALPGGIGFTFDGLSDGYIKGKYDKLSGFSRLLIDYTLTSKTIKKVQENVVNYFIENSMQEDEYHDTLADALNRLMHFGFVFADLSGISLNLYDFANLPVKDLMRDDIAKADAAVSTMETWYQLGCCSEEGRNEFNVKTWNDATTVLKKKITSEFKNGDSFDRMSSIFMILDSGARGTVDQLLAISGLVGIVTNSSGHSIPSPIRSSYIDGLSTSEFFQNAATARRQVASAQLSTAGAGALTREYIYLNEHQHIRNDDTCCDAKGLWIDIDYEVSLPNGSEGYVIVSNLAEIKDYIYSHSEDFPIFPGAEEKYAQQYMSVIAKLIDIAQTQVFTEDLLSVIPKLHIDQIICKNNSGELKCIEPIIKMSDISRSQLKYRVLDAESFKAEDPSSYTIISNQGMSYIGGTPEGIDVLNDDGELIVSNPVIGDAIISAIEKNTILRVPIYSIIGCRSTGGICKRCFGLNYSTLAFPENNERVGYQAVQAIGEPITQIILDSHKREFTGEESLTAKLDRILKTEIRSESIPSDAVYNMPFATDNLEARVETDTSGDKSGHYVGLYNDAGTCVQRVPYTNLVDLNFVTGQKVPKGSLLVRDLDRESVLLNNEEGAKNENGINYYNYWASLVDFSEIQKYVWKMLCLCFSSDSILARNFEIFARSISEFGIASKSDAQKGIIKGNIYLTTQLCDAGVPYTNISVGMKSAMKYSNKVLAGAAHSDFLSHITSGIIRGTIDNPNSNIGKSAIGYLTTAKLFSTPSVRDVRIEEIETLIANDDAASTVSEASVIAGSDTLRIEDLFKLDDDDELPFEENAEVVSTDRTNIFS